MKKTDKSNLIVCILFCVFLFSESVALLIFPGKDYSENEKRFLKTPPAFSMQNILSGDYAEALEAYFADRIPGRTFFVGLHSYMDQILGIRAGKEIVSGKSGRLYEAPVQAEENIISDNITAIQEFAEKIGTDVSLMLIPSAGYIMKEDIPKGTDAYQDGEIADFIASRTAERIHTIDLFSLFETYDERKDLYYATDHHWTSLGAYMAYSALSEEMNFPALPADRYDVETAEDFYGTTYSRSALWLTPSESMELWHSGADFIVSCPENETEHSGVFYTEHLKEADKYPVFLDGNHSLVRIENKNALTERKLLVVRDSFTNCLGCFLADSFSEVVLVDLRYYKYPVSDLVKMENIDDVLITYGVGNFMNNSYLGFLE